MAGIIRSIISFFLDFIETAVVALALFVIVYLFVFQPHQVKGNSMYPNFHDAEYLLTNKITYKVGEPKRGDVIIFKAPKNEDYDYIKRIIGLPGETIKISKGQVYINNELLQEEAYLDESVKTRAGLFLSEDQNYSIPQGEYFAFGDNREHSSDSRDWGGIPTSNIIGKAWFRYWPPTKIGLVPGITYPQFGLN